MRDGFNYSASTPVAPNIQHLNSSKNVANRRHCCTKDAVPRKNRDEVFDRIHFEKMSQLRLNND